MKSTVALQKSNDSFDGTYKALESIENTIIPKILNSNKVVIKINMVAAVVELATTPSESVRAFIEFIRNKGYKKEITIAELSVFAGTELGFKMHGFDKIAKEYDAKLINLAKDETVDIDVLHGTEKKQVLPYSKTIKESDYLVSMTRAKTHDTVVATLAVKNVAIGAVTKGRALFHQGNLIHTMLINSIHFKKPDLGIIDGIRGMEGNGPAWGSPIESGWVCAGEDLLALDTLGVYLMGFDIENIGYLKMLKDQGFGNAYPSENVEIIGELPEKLVKKYKPHKGYSSQIEWK